MKNKGDFIFIAVPIGQSMEEELKRICFTILEEQNFTAKEMNNIVENIEILQSMLKKYRQKFINPKLIRNTNARKYLQ